MSPSLTPLGFAARSPKGAPSGSPQYRPIASPVAGLQASPMYSAVPATPEWWPAAAPAVPAPGLWPGGGMPGGGGWMLPAAAPEMYPAAVNSRPAMYQGGYP